MLKQVKIAGFIACITLFFMVFGIIKNAPYTNAGSRGDYFFEKTKNNPNIKSIVLKSSDNQTVTIEKKGDLWRIKEIDDYFADFVKISELVKLINRTTIYRADHVEDDIKEKYMRNPISIASYSSDGHVVDETLIVPKTQSNKFSYALKNEDSFLYQIQGNFNLSFHPLNWIKMPLLDVPYNQVKHLKTNNFDAFRRFATEEFQNVVDKTEVPQIKNIINKFWYLTAEDVSHETHFDASKYKLVKTYELTDMDGLIYNIYIYSNSTEFWLKIALDREKIISSHANFKLKETAILYDGWFFRINTDIGKQLIGFVL